PILCGRGTRSILVGGLRGGRQRSHFREEALWSTSRCSVGWACHAALTRLVQQLTLVTRVGDTTRGPVSRDTAIARDPNAFRNCRVAHPAVLNVRRRVPCADI